MTVGHTVIAFGAAAIAVLALRPQASAAGFTIEQILLSGLYLTPVPILAAALAHCLLTRQIRSIPWARYFPTIWFAPVTVLVAAGSPLAGLAVVLGVAHWTAMEGQQLEEARLRVSALAAITLQGALLLVLFGRYALATVLLLFPLVLLLRGLAPFQKWRVSAAMAPLAVVLCLFGLSLSLRRTAPMAAPLLETAFDAPEPEPESTAPGTEERSAHRGVILLPPKEETVRIVPPVPSLARSMAMTQLTKPVKIPFFGVYWLFQSPHRRPPQTALRVRGLPSEKTFRSVDSRALRMEAHQNLGTAIPMSCCSAIEIEVTNADPFSRYAQLELLLGDSTLTSKAWHSLGSLPLNMAPLFAPRQPIAALPDVLRYPIPATVHLSRFDSFAVRFHRRPLTDKRSANIAITNFVLVPRRF